MKSSFTYIIFTLILTYVNCADLNLTNVDTKNATQVTVAIENFLNNSLPEVKEIIKNLTHNETFVASVNKTAGDLIKVANLAHEQFVQNMETFIAFISAPDLEERVTKIVVQGAEVLNAYLSNPVIVGLVQSALDEHDEKINIFKQNMLIFTNKDDDDEDDDDDDDKFLFKPSLDKFHGHITPVRTFFRTYLAPNNELF